MKHKKYSSIPNSYRGEIITAIQQYLPSDLKWVAHEKIHGSNASFYVSEDGVYARASRNRSLGEGDGHYGIRKIQERLDGALCEIYEACVPHFERVDKDFNPYIIIYGEVFGGSYPHPDVKPMDGTRKVQSGVFYSADNEFLVFDIRVVKGQDKNEYLTPSQLAKVVSESLRVPEILKSTLEECLALDVEFETKVPTHLGLPTRENPTITEGIVIRPWDYGKRLPNGDRPLLKKKSQRFRETSRLPKKASAGVPALTEEQRGMCAKASEYITLPRLENVVSKLPEEVANAGFKSFGIFLKNLVADSIDDFKVENPVLASMFVSLNVKELKTMNRILGFHAQKVVRKWLENANL